MLVGRLFGDAWGMFTTNMQAAIATRSVTTPVTSRISDFKRGLFGGSMSYGLGHSVSQRWRKDKTNFSSEEESTPGGSPPQGTPPNRNGNSTHSFKKNSPTAPFSQALAGRGLEIQTENPKQGIVAVSGNGYKYDDPKTGLSTIYPTRTEAIQDGVPEQKLETIRLDQNRFIDLSSFHKTNPNPHNFNAMQEAKKRGKEINYAYINELSPPQKIKQFLEIAKERNETYGVSGVIVKRQGNQTSDHIIRMYSYKNHEKRTDL